MLFRILVCLLILLTTQKTTMAHNGPHDNSCLVSLGDANVQLTGVQKFSKRPDRHYCRIFPEKGLITFTASLQGSDFDDSKVSLTYQSISAWSNLILNPMNAFDVVIKKAPLQAISGDVVALEKEFEQPGIYALNIILEHDSGEQYQKRLFFLVGYPIAKIFINIAMVLFLCVCIIFLRQSIRAKKQS